MAFKPDAPTTVARLGDLVVTIVQPGDDRNLYSVLIEAESDAPVVTVNVSTATEAKEFTV